MIYQGARAVFYPSGGLGVDDYGKTSKKQDSSAIIHHSQRLIIKKMICNEVVVYICNSCSIQSCNGTHREMGVPQNIETMARLCNNFRDSHNHTLRFTHYQRTMRI